MKLFFLVNNGDIQDLRAMSVFPGLLKLTPNLLPVN